MPNHHFISYSSIDALDFAFRLRDELEAGPPPTPVWLDRRDIQPGEDWDEAIAEALKTCRSLLFVMTRDSVEDESVCKREWTHALRYKKPVIPIKLHPDAEMPFRLAPRQHIDFARARESDEEFNAALARLRKHLAWLASPAGTLHSLKDRLTDAQRDLRRADDAAQRARIQDDIDQLKRDIAKQEEVVRDPQAAERRVEESIARGLERERQPERPVAGVQRSKFINPPPGLAPTYFQDRDMETGTLGSFLKDEAVRLITVVGRGGTGKTALVCRLLKSLEGGQLPDDGGPLEVGGIVYLSATGTRRVNMPNLYSDLSKLLRDEAAVKLDSLFKNPQASTEAKMSALLLNFNEGRTVALLDNFEDVMERETLAVRDAELDEALRALLSLPHHTVKVILTTRLVPRDLALVQPGRQRRLDLDEGLASPYAENILREMDTDGKVGLKNAPDELLGETRERTRGYPRALEALFAILSADRDTSLRDILDDTTNLLPENVVRELVGEAFNRLDTAAQQVMQALAVYGHPVTHAAVDYLLQPHLPGIDSAPVLKRLVNMQFARRETGRYYLHPVDRAYALSRIPRGESSDRDEEDAPPYTQFALLHRAAEYFKQSRLPREDWKTIEDLAPQLAEFDLRCEGEDYDTAGWLLLSIDYDYLDLWGYYRLMAKLHERLQLKLTHQELRFRSLVNLGLAYMDMGRYKESVNCFEQALAHSRELGHRGGEGVCLSYLGLCYRDLGQFDSAINYQKQALSIARQLGDRHSEEGDSHNLGLGFARLGYTTRALELYSQALEINRETGDRNWEANHLGAIGRCHAALGNTLLAIDYLERSLAIKREIGEREGEGIELLGLGVYHAYFGEYKRAMDCLNQALTIARDIGARGHEKSCLTSMVQVLIDMGHINEAVDRAAEAVKIGSEIGTPLSYANGKLALAYLYAGELSRARAAVEAAQQYDEPQNNAFVSSLLGLIAVRQGDVAAALEAFMEAAAQADELLTRNAQNYGELDDKGLALCGMVLCGGGKHIAAASEAYRAARAINKDAGVVGRVLRLFDTLAEADAAGVLAGVRAAAGGE